MANVHIPKPCHEDWARMTPNQRGRHCAVCDKTVVDVTRMAPTAGRRFIAEELPRRLAEGAHLCVRAHADTRGRLLSPGVTRRLLTNGLAAVLAMTIAGCQGDGPAVSTAGGQGQAQTATQTQRGSQAQTPAQCGAEMGEAVEVQPVPGRVAPLQQQPQPIEPLQGDVKEAPQRAPQPMLGALAPLPPAQCVKGEIAMVNGDVAVAPAPVSATPAPQPEPVRELSGKPVAQPIAPEPQDAMRR